MRNKRADRQAGYHSKNAAKGAIIVQRNSKVRARLARAHARENPTRLAISYYFSLFDRPRARPSRISLHDKKRASDVSEFCHTIKKGTDREWTDTAT
jgi:hypothetical protein